MTKNEDFWTETGQKRGF